MKNFLFFGLLFISLPIISSAQHRTDNHGNITPNERTRSALVRASAPSLELNERIIAEAYNQASPAEKQRMDKKLGNLAKYTMQGQCGVLLLSSAAYSGGLSEQYHHFATPLCILNVPLGGYMIYSSMQAHKKESLAFHEIVLKIQQRSESQV